MKPAERARPWTWLVVAAVVAVIVTAVAATAAWKADQGDDFPGSPRAGTVLPQAPEGTVPSVFAHTRASATRLLEAAGLRVRFDEEDSCVPAGRLVGTEPATGALVDPGDTVTVLVSFQGPTTDCIGFFEEAWRFMDFATGRGPAPTFAEEVRLYVDGKAAGSMSGSEAAHGDWGDLSALTALAGASEQVLRTRDGFVPPTLQVDDGTPPDVVCGVTRPAGLGDREAENLTVALPDQEHMRCPTRVALYRTDGAIDAVVLSSARSSAEAGTARVPDVVGLTVPRAREAVTAAGYTAHVEELEVCHPRPAVVEQAPTQRDLDSDLEDDPDWSHVVTLVVEVPHTTRDCDALDRAAEAFVRFAEGGAAPDWAPEVQQLFGYDLQDTITADQADDPAAWSDALSAVRSGPSEADESRDSYECEMADLGGLPPELGDVEDQITLFPTDPADCGEDWAVQIWVDDTGGIRAVNLLLPRSVVEDD